MQSELKTDIYSGHICFLYEQLMIVVELRYYYTYYTNHELEVRTSRFGNEILADIILKCDRKAMRLQRIGVSVTT